MTCHFKRRRFIPVNYSQMNDILSAIKSRAGRFYFRDYNPAIDKLGFDAWVNNGMRFLKVTTKYNGVIATYVFDLCDGDVAIAKRIGCSTGLSAFLALLREMGDNKKFVPHIVKPEDMIDGKNVLPFSASPFLYHNPKFNGKAVQAWGYDMNSAYSYAMLCDIPDTRAVKTIFIDKWNCGIVEEGQIGFDTAGNLVDKGKFAMFRFKAIPSPYKEFVNKYFNKKIHAKSKEEKQFAKDTLNLAVGYYQRHNPFIRANIVGNANKYIESLIDENTIYCNTDSIVSAVPRNDLKLGNGLGEWKIEHIGIFKHIDFNYQWDMEKPAYRGIPNSWFDDTWDILKDQTPSSMNKYEFDMIKLKLVRRKYGIKS